MNIPKWPDPIDWKEKLKAMENHEPEEDDFERDYQTKQLFEFSIREISDELGIPFRTAVNTLYRALKHFKVNLLIYNVLKRYELTEPVTDATLEVIAQEVSDIIESGRIDEELSKQY